MPSHNLARMKIDDYDIVGYSVAGEETVVSMPQLDVCFDIGKAPDQLVNINNVLLTHGHMDHSAGIAYYLSHRKFVGQKPGTVLASENILQHIDDIIRTWGRLDGNRIPANLVAMKSGDDYFIKPNLFVRAFATKHSKGSLGFCVIEKKKKLKEEYLGLSGHELVELKKKNIQIDYPVETPLVSYLGDTSYMDFRQYDYVAKSKFLIAECTFVADEHTDRALAGDHMHIDDFLKLLHELDNQYVIVTHLSQRTYIVEAKKILKEKLSPALYEKTFLLMDRKHHIR
ncbi:MAG: MBL fold metallo-hydrolase [Phycisphaerales bacterium]